MTQMEKTAGVPANQIITSDFNDAVLSLSKEELEGLTEGTPQESELWMKKGHALVKKGLYREGIAAYSMGLTYDPFHAKLLRYRGHRYLSVRFFQQGASDLEASSRFDDKNWDTWYHLGLAYYLLGDFARAEKAYEVCLPMTPDTKDPTLLPAITAWLWRTKIKLGKKEEAQALLTAVDPDFDAGENQFYQNCVLVYAGLAQPETLKYNKDGSELTPIGIGTQGYGLSTYYESLGDTQKAQESNQWIIDNGFWAAFGYLAAEADLQREKA